jgi:ribose-phosphate pyrophosphokinase
MEHRLTVFAGPASLELGAEVCAAIHVSRGRYVWRQFPDGETEIEVQQSVRGHDVYLVQSTSPPVEQHLMQLLLLADACRRAGAARLTAIIPYLGYARQDRRVDRRSLGARVAADVIGAGRFDRVMLIDAHTPGIEGFFDIPVDHLTATPRLAAAVARLVTGNGVVVAPDLGAVKLARGYAKALRLPMAIVHKTRLSGEIVEAEAVIGDVRGRRPIVVDDMLSTGGTVAAAVKALRAAGSIEPIAVAVTHVLLAGRARELLGGLSLECVMATDTVAVSPSDSARLEITSVAPLIASAIQANHREQSLASLRASV